ncbi:MAG: AAA family ATPase [Vulcanimicrobiota bacterium]
MSRNTEKQTKQQAVEPEELQRPPAERLYASELRRLTERDRDRPKPRGWLLTPESVLAFVRGDEKLGISAKFVGKRSFVERCIVALATSRGLMLIGEPGTAKSYLSELIAAAISGDSSLTIQGSAGTTEDSIKYSWNYALLIAEGPSERSLVPAPVYRGMREGKIVRFEEITRCPLEIQDVLLSVLSDRVMAVPELSGTERNLYAAQGFNIIATANTRDRGVNEMSSALKRRFNFETVHPIADIREEMELIERESAKMLQQAAIPITLKPPVIELIVTTFHELRNGKTAEGQALEQPTSAMSVAEAIACAFSTAVHAYYYGDGDAGPEQIVNHLAGTVLKDAPEDLQKLRHYFDHAVREKKGAHWKAYHEARKSLP